MGISFWQIAVVAVLVILLFGRGKISDLMGDVAKGIKNFKKGMAEELPEDDASEEQTEEQKAIADKRAISEKKKDKTTN